MRDNGTNFFEKNDTPKVNLSFESAIFTVILFNIYYLCESTQ